MTVRDNRDALLAPEEQQIEQIVSRVTQAFRAELADIMRDAACQHDYRHSAKFGGSICSLCNAVARAAHD